MASEGTRVFIPDNETVWRPATVLTVRDVDDGTRIFSVQCEPLGAHPDDPESSSSTLIAMGGGALEVNDKELAGALELRGRRDASQYISPRATLRRGLRGEALCPRNTLTARERSRTRGGGGVRARARARAIRARHTSLRRPRAARGLNELPLQNTELPIEGAPDMCSLNYLHEAAVLHNLRARFFGAIPYTYTGEICIALNPYRWLDLYRDDAREAYTNALAMNSGADAAVARAEFSPHV
jgi:hypothetical protein